MFGRIGHACPRSRQRADEGRKAVGWFLQDRRCLRVCEAHAGPISPLIVAGSFDAGIRLGVLYQGKIYETERSHGGLTYGMSPLEFLGGALQMIAGRLNWGTAPATYEEQVYRRIGRLPGVDGATDLNDWWNQARRETLGGVRKIKNLYCICQPGTDFASWCGLEAAKAIVADSRDEFDRDLDPVSLFGVAN